MKSILLAGGEGTRLRPITKKTPKCLVPIHGKPLLGIWLSKLRESELGPFLINTHYLSHKVEEFVTKGSYEDVTLVHESKLLGTAGTLIENINFFEEKDGLLLHADNYCTADFMPFIEAHYKRPKECLLTMMTFNSDNPQSCGIVETNQENIVMSFHEKQKSPPGNIANGAIYILSPEFQKIISSEYIDSFDFSIDIIPNFLGKIFSYNVGSLLMDIGTPENYRIANLIKST